MKKTYLFLDDEIYSPEGQSGVFGKEVEITEKKGDECWFTVKETGKKGYVVYPHLFAENTPENIEKVNDFKKKMSDAKNLEKAAWLVLKTVKRGKLNFRVGI